MNIFPLRNTSKKKTGVAIFQQSREVSYSKNNKNSTNHEIILPRPM